MNEQTQAETRSDNTAPPQPAEPPAPTVTDDPPRLTREDKIIYWSVAAALLILTPLVLYVAFRARTGL